MQLLMFLDHLNSKYEYIKFTVSYYMANISVPFLDTVVTIGADNMSYTDLQKKDTAVVILPSSNHLGHITKNILYSLFVDGYINSN